MKKTILANTAQSYDIAREKKTFLVGSSIVIMAAFLYGIDYVLGGLGMSYVIFQFLMGVILLLNLVVYVLYPKYRKIAPILTTVVAAAVLFAGLIHGGNHGTSIYWIFGYSLASFLFVGFRMGLVLNFIFLVAIACLYGAQKLGIFSSFYSFDELFQAGVVFAVYLSFGAILQKSRDRLQDQALKDSNRFSVLWGEIPAGMILVDVKDHKISLFNHKAQEYLGGELAIGKTMEECIGKKHFTMANGEPYELENIPVVEVVTTDIEESSKVLFMSDAGGKRRAYRCSSVSLGDSYGKKTGVISLLEDMTQEQEVNRMKTELVSLASHQLKTPLTGLKWSMESLLGEDDGKLNTAQKEMVSESLTIVDRLSNLVKDLLSVSRIEAGSKFDIVMKQVDVIPVLNSVISEYEEMAKRRGVKIESPSLLGELVLFVDEGKFREVFMNLVGNAVKYSTSGGTVEVGLHPDNEHGHIIFVKDEGIGIPKEEQSKIFSRFYRATNVSDEMEGTGLGLYIAQVIIERHDGHIWFDSKEGKGTTFYAQFR